MSPMKIHDINQAKQLTKPYITDSSRPNQGVSFHELLESQLHKTSHSMDVHPAQKTADVSSVPTSLRLESISLTETTLQNLESFENGLKNKALSADTLEPLVSSLEENIAALVSYKNQIDAQDPLANLLDRVATSTYVETMKYRRGDYETP